MPRGRPRWRNEEEESTHNTEIPDLGAVVVAEVGERLQQMLPDLFDQMKEELRTYVGQRNAEERTAGV